MSDRWWAIRREKELRDTVTSTNQFIDKLESILDEDENDPEKLKSKIREVIKQHKKIL
jgi:hypothetical protein